ncbi:MAG: FHA domain-containing protein [Deltaproteobacteria bacterium]|nr:FHA domain-containing protein [Deltaproteobacteria bacterium]
MKIGNADRRGGIGFGNQRRVDSGARSGGADYDDDNGESTRAMSIEDVDPPPTEFVRSPAPAPRAAARPAPRPMARPAPPPPPAMGHGDDEEEAATRMLDAMPDDLPAPSSRAPQPMGRALDLKVVSGPDRGKVHHIGEGDSLVGRGLDCQIVLADPAVSRKHFQLRRSGDQVVLEDLGGPNGTKVNGDKRARQILEPGDQIEIGMSVLEYQIDGVGKRKDSGRSAGRDDDRPMRQVAEPRAAAKPQSGGGGPGKIIAIAAVLVLLLIGGGVTAWLVMGKKSSDKPAAGAEGEADGDVGALIDKAKKQIADKEFTAAVATLKKAQELDKTAPEIAPLKRQASQEATAQKALQEGKEAMEAGNNEEALAKLTSEDIGKESVFRAEADQMVIDVKKALVTAKLDEAKKALAAGDNAKADAAIKVILEVEPDNGDAKMLQGQLAGAAPPPVAGPDAGASADAGAPAAAVKPAEGKPGDVKPAEAAVAAAPGKKADFAGGLAAYGARQWSAAIQTFEAIASGPYSKDEKKKAAAYVAGIKRVEAAWNKAQSAAGKAAGAAWKDAREADSEVDGHHKAFLTDQVIKAYVAAAKAARAAGNCGEAVENAEVANDYSATGSHPDAKAVIDGCKADGKNLLQQAEQALAAGQSAKAKELAARADKILGSDPLALKAKEILKKASAAGRGEE